MEPRYKILNIPYELLVNLLRIDGTRPLQIKGLPEDAVIVGDAHDIFYNRVSLKIWSASFPLIPDGNCIEELQLECLERKDVYIGVMLPTKSGDANPLNRLTECQLPTGYTLANPIKHDNVYPNGLKLSEPMLTNEGTKVAFAGELSRFPEETYNSWHRRYTFLTINPERLEDIQRQRTQGVFAERLPDCKLCYGVGYTISQCGEPCIEYCKCKKVEQSSSYRICPSMQKWIAEPEEHLIKLVKKEEGVYEFEERILTPTENSQLVSSMEQMQAQVDITRETLRWPGEPAESYRKRLAILDNEQVIVNLVQMRKNHTLQPNPECNKCYGVGYCPNELDAVPTLLFCECTAAKPLQGCDRRSPKEYPPGTHFNIKVYVEKQEEDGVTQYIARVARNPEYKVCGETCESAINNLQMDMTEVLRLYRNRGEVFPWGEDTPQLPQLGMVTFIGVDLNEKSHSLESATCGEILAEMNENSSPGLPKELIGDPEEGTYSSTQLSNPFYKE